MPWPQARRSLLVVDDDPRFRAGMSHALQVRGFAVAEAASLRAATAAMARARPALVVVNGALPDGGGAAWIQRLRGEGDHVPVVLVTSSWKDLHSFERLARELGVLLIAHKPVPAVLLAESIKTLLGRAVAGGDLAITVDGRGGRRPVARPVELARRLPGALAELLGNVTLARAGGDAGSRAEARRTADRLRAVAAAHGSTTLAEAATELGRALDGHAAGAPEIEAALEAVVAAARAATGEPSAPRSRRPRVLIVDDERGFPAQAAALLQTEGVETTHLADPLRLLDAMDEVEPDLVLLDSILPALSGLDVCRLLRATPRWQDVPIVFTSPDLGPDVRLAAFHAGVDDYLPRPVADAELLARVRVRLQRARLLRERIATDAVTGLLLRQPFVDAAVTRLAEARRHHTSLTLTRVEVDGIGALNEEHGPLAGDHVLATFGRLLATRLRAGDLRGRWDGGELVLIFAGHTPRTTALVIDRLHGEVERLVFRGRGGVPYRVTFSSGIASYPNDGVTLDDLMTVAGARLGAEKPLEHTPRTQDDVADATAVAG